MTPFILIHLVVCPEHFDMFSQFFNFEKYKRSATIVFFFFSPAVSDASRAMGGEGTLGPGLWRPYPSRLGIPGYPVNLQEHSRNMYSLYGSLLGLSAASLSLPGLSVHPLTSGAVTPTSTTLSAHMLLSAQAQQQAAAAAAQDAGSAAAHRSSPLRSPTAAAALYGQRYHPYHLPSPTALKRPDSGSLSIP